MYNTYKDTSIKGNTDIDEIINRTLLALGLRLFDYGFIIANPALVWIQSIYLLNTIQRSYVIATVLIPVAHQKRVQAKAIYWNLLTL